MTSEIARIDAPYTPGRGIPAALPLGSSGNDQSLQVSDSGGISRGTNTPRTSSSEKGVRRLGRVDARALARIDEALPDRDRLVLALVAEHRYLSTHQVQHFAFTDLGTEESAARTTRRVLQRLERTHLLRSLERRIGGVRAGSAARIWQLTPAAARLLRDDGTTFRTHEPSPRFLSHCLAVADVHIGLRELRGTRGIESVEVQTEPSSWRRYTGPGGEARWLQPDLAAVVSTADFDDRWFIEVDLGTESLPTLLKKCGQYEAYRATGIEQGEHGVFPLVLWLFTKPERADKLQHSIARSPRLAPQLYRYATPETLLDSFQGGAT